MPFPNDKTKFKKGESGNPKGRAKKLPALDDLLSEVLGEDGEGESAAKEIIKALHRRAIKGDVRAAEVLLERAYGKVKQDIEQHTILRDERPDISILSPEQRRILATIQLQLRSGRSEE
jgi:hypothetical protein